MAVFADVLLFSNNGTIAPLDNEARLHFECCFPWNSIKKMKRWRLEEENGSQNRKQIEAGSKTTLMTFHCKGGILTVIDLSPTSHFQFHETAKELCSFLRAFQKPLKER